MRIATGSLTLLVVLSVVIVPSSARSQSGPSASASVASPCNEHTLLERLNAQGSAPGGQRPTPAERLLELARQRRLWNGQQRASYRLCLITLNALLTTAREVDVVDGRVRIARGAWGRRAGQGQLTSQEWAPDAGVTVEGLFDQIERGLRRMLVPAGKDAPSYERFVIAPTYDRQLGYPVAISSAPDPAVGIVYDADVLTLISVSALPDDPLPPISIGRVFADVRPARITRPLATYHTLLGFASREQDDRIRSLWPDLWPTILERANTTYWTKVGWKPRAGQLGRLLGTVKIDSGATIYLMELQHNGAPLYLPIATDAVEHLP